MEPLYHAADVKGQPVSVESASNQNATPAADQNRNGNGNLAGGQPPAAPAYGGYGTGAQGAGGGYGNPGPAPSYGNHGPAPSYGGRSAVSRNDAPVKINPISSLNPYMNRWTIRARVTNQPTLRTYHNAKGDGKVLNVDLLDAEGGEIKAVCFGDTAEAYAEKFRAGVVYDVSKAQLQSVRNKQYSNHDFEIRLDHGSVVEECSDQAAISRIKRINYAFRKISDLEQIPSGAMVDVVAVVHAVGELVTIMKRDGS